MINKSVGTVRTRAIGIIIIITGSPIPKLARSNLLSFIGFQSSYCDLGS
jgi:hypothetical protein